MSFWNPNSLHYVIDWSAWATLVVGIAAVIGAVVIGKKQAAIALRQATISDRQAQIMERQTDIASRQAKTEEVRLRAELYDKRVAVYSGLEQYLAEASGNDGIVTSDVRDGLFKSLSVARFLLDERVEELGRRLHTVSVNLRSNVRKLDKENDDEKRAAIVDKLESNHNDLGNLQRELREGMVKYLRLSHE